MIFLTELPEVSTICLQHFKTYHAKLQRTKSSPASAAEDAAVAIGLVYSSEGQP